MTELANMEIRYTGNGVERLKQAAVAQLELPFAKLKKLTDTDIDNLKCEQKYKDTLKKAKEGSIKAIAQLPGAVLNVLMAKLGNDGKHKEAFNSDTMYQIALEDSVQRAKLENMS